MGTITIINAKPYKEQPIPEVGKEYHVFDDGKINPLRHSLTTIIDVIPFGDEDFETDVLDAWLIEKEECDWLYAKETDFFVKAMGERDAEPQYFVRTTDGGWFFSWLVCF